MLILVNKLEKISDFKENEKIETTEIVANLKLLNCEKIIAEAKELDKKDFNENCFCIAFNYIYEEDKLYILNVPNSIYYVDINGEKNYFEVDNLIIGNIERSIYMEFKKFLKNKQTYIEKNSVLFQEI